MKFELQQRLFERFPNLFIDRHLPMTQTCMCWGIECGNGWYDLIWKMCEKLENLNFNSLKFTQVKEKTGTLRVYYEYLIPRYTLRGLNSKEKRKLKRSYKNWEYKIDSIINNAEIVSFNTCSICGNPGKPIGESSWSSIICEKCKEELNARKL